MCFFSQEKSLVKLASRFLRALFLRPDKSVDLNVVSTELNVPKRRLYDVTNVLEGVKYIRKLGKNTIQWIGVPEEGSEVFTTEKVADAHQNDLPPQHSSEMISEEELQRLKSYLSSLHDACVQKDSSIEVRAKIFTTIDSSDLCCSFSVC